MTAIIYGTACGVELTWSRRAAVYEYLLEDIVKCVQDEALCEKLLYAVGIQGLDLDELSPEHLKILSTCSKRVRQEYMSRSPGVPGSVPDYAYLVVALDELLDIIGRLMTRPSAHG